MSAPFYRPEEALGPDPDPNDPTPGMHLWGWMSPIELRWLAEQASQMRSVVEIGCLHGRSSYALATGCPGTVYCLDPWNDAGYESWMNSVGEVLPNVVGIRGASPEAGALVPDPVDMVFIDGAHDYQSVLADVLYWRARTRVLLCGHDYTEGPDGYPDVKTVVDFVFGDEVVVAPDTAIWTVRP